MTTRINTTVRNTMVDSLNGTFTVFKVYTGSQPTSADAPATGTLLGTIDIVNGFNTSVDGSATLAATETGTGVATGTAGWGRLQDAGGTYRIDGTVGVQGSGADFAIGSISVTNGGPVLLTDATLNMPGG